MRPDRVDVVWQRRRGLRGVQLVALLAAVVAPAAVLGVFNEFGLVKKVAHAPSQLIANIDLRIATPFFEARRGEDRARADVAAGLLKLQGFAPLPATKADQDKAERLKRLYGISWVNHGGAPTPLERAYAEGYNRVAEAEIERRHGQGFLKRLLREDGPGALSL